MLLRPSFLSRSGSHLTATAALAATLFGATALPAAAAGVALSGANEVPAVQSAASGTAMIAVADDGTVSGHIHTSGITGTAAHIHVGAAGKNGPVAVMLTKGEDGSWQVPAGTHLTPDQLQHYKAGELYVNVHSETNRGGEIRGQLAP